MSLHHQSNTFLLYPRDVAQRFMNSVDLLQLVEDAVDGCWVGHRARTGFTGDSGIGSLYSPPKEEVGSPSSSKKKLVETIVDIGYRSEVCKLSCGVSPSPELRARAI